MSGKAQNIQTGNSVEEKSDLCEIVGYPWT
jgi:hypothetical protein